VPRPCHGAPVTPRSNTDAPRLCSCVHWTLLIAGCLELHDAAAPPHRPVEARPPHSPVAPPPRSLITRSMPRRPGHALLIALSPHSRPASTAHAGAPPRQVLLGAGIGPSLPSSAARPTPCRCKPNSCG
jgi:hypothetical protein